ncbi:YolD-like family protein [Planococcus dechangensis]|uniref:YolD-like family protein n=1 Tax=Planococcus dechangensis TaxID=1176255 RepID=A0ABV9M8P2_9BACL
MTETNSISENKGRSHTQWDTENVVSDPQPLLSADEQQSIWDMLLVACERKGTVFIQIWHDRHFHFHQCTIRELDYLQQIVICENDQGERQLAIGAITSLHMLD